MKSFWGFLYAFLLVGAWFTLYIVIYENPPLGTDRHRWKWACFVLLQVIPFALLLISLLFLHLCE
jgi:hypothetical protein